VTEERGSEDTRPRRQLHPPGPGAPRQLVQPARIRQKGVADNPSRGPSGHLMGADARGLYESGTFQPHAGIGAGSGGLG
jgi:hypothetical protein